MTLHPKNFALFGGFFDAYLLTLGGHFRRVRLQKLVPGVARRGLVIGGDGRVEPWNHHHHVVGCGPVGSSRCVFESDASTLVV